MNVKNPSTDNPQAGRELDMLVAEKIMGLGDKPELPDCWPGRGFHTGKNGEWELIPIAGGGMDWIPPHYSTDIAEAWKVLGKLEECGLFTVVQRFSSDSWMCVLRLANGSEPCYARALTAPVAICEAARQFIAMGAVSARASK